MNRQENVAGQATCFDSLCRMIGAKEGGKMHEENKCIAFLKECRAHPEKSMPMVDHQYMSWLGECCGFEELNRLNDETGATVDAR